MPHVHALQGAPPPPFPRHHPTLPHARCLAPLVPQGGQVVETIVGPKIAAIANAVKAMCQDAPAAAAE